MKTLERNNIKISNDNTLLDKQNHITPYIANILERLYNNIPKGNESTLKKLLKYTSQFPKVPIFKNYLMSFYAQKGNMQKAQQVNKWLVKEHPDYLYGKINYANYLLDKGKTSEVLNILGEHLLLHELYPERDEFLLDEVISFYAFTIRYLYDTDKEDEANSRLEILEELDDENHKVIQAQHFKQKYIFKKVSLRYKEEEKARVSVKTKDRRSHLQTITPPKFNYPTQIYYLYNNTTESISADQLKEFYILDREKLADDLIKALYDSIYRHDFFYNGYEDENQIYFPIHSLILLLFLKEEKALNVILEILRQDDDFIEFWFGYSLSEYTVPLLYHIGKNHKEKLTGFIKEDHVSCFNKSIAVDSLIKLYAFDDSINRKDTLTYLGNILDFLIFNHNNPKILDTEFNGLFIVGLMDYGATELLPKIKEMYRLKIVGENICGNYEDVVADINEKSNIEPVAEFNTLEAIYEAFAYYEEPENNNLPYQFFENNQPTISEKKVGRNEPCPCGSGKKHKKCCLNN